MECAVAAHELGERVHHDVGAVIDRTAQVRRGEGVVDHQRHVVLVRDLGDGLDVQHVAARIGDGLAVEALGLGRDGLAEVFRIVGIDELDVVAHLAEADVELRVGAAVERAGGHHFVARFQQAVDGEELRRLSAGHRQARDAVFERRDALLQHVRRRVHDARIDVAELLQREQLRGVLGILENERGGLVDRHRAGAGGGIRLVAVMQGAGVESEVTICVVGHRVYSICPTKLREGCGR